MRTRLAFVSQVMVEDSLLQMMQLPYNVFASGPYTPSCNEERMAYSDKLHLMDSKPDAQVAFCFDPYRAFYWDFFALNVL